MIFKPTDKGQALVLIVLAAVGLFGFAALAIDGSMVFSDRRHAQNAADTAALGAALTRVRGGDWKLAGEKRAASNSYANDGVSVVKVYSCLEWLSAPENITGEECKGLPPSPTNDIREEYIIVWIKSVVKLTFARVIGRAEITNYTDAVVHASPVDIDEWFDGMAMVSDNTECAGPGEFGPFDAGGSGVTVINNSGIFVNANCPEAFEDNGSGGSLTTTEGICLVGGYDHWPMPSGVSPMPEEGCSEQIDINQYWMPDTDPALLAASCSTNGSLTEVASREYEAEPGCFGGSCVGGAFPDEPRSGILRLKKGIYCLKEGLDLNAGWTLTTDANGNGVFEPATEGVFFYVPNGDVELNGGAHIDLHAMKDTTGGWPASLMNYLIFVPSSNRADIFISGDGGSTFTGMILAPTSALDIQGNSSNLDLHTQIIALNTRITGNGTVNITYDPNDVPPAIIMPKISQTE